MYFSTLISYHTFYCNATVFSHFSKIGGFAQNKISLFLLKKGLLFGNKNVIMIRYQCLHS